MPSLSAGTVLRYPRGLVEATFPVQNGLVWRVEGAGDMNIFIPELFPLLFLVGSISFLAGVAISAIISGLK